MSQPESLAQDCREPVAFRPNTNRESKERVNSGRVLEPPFVDRIYQILVNTIKHVSIRGQGLLNETKGLNYLQWVTHL
jgi:hypothetical protein